MEAYTAADGVETSAEGQVHTESTDGSASANGQVQTQGVENPRRQLTRRQIRKLPKAQRELAELQRYLD
eukprot:12287093-Karenia_brevis.AAC.1